jgi:molecular chaperone DnaK (HSP70)
MTTSVGASFLVGIDLGTTNTVVASGPADGAAPPEVLAIPQLVTASEVEARPLLPSTLYAPLEAEQARDPWEDGRWVGGAFARRRGAEVSGRQIVSAKSWLAHGAVDRHVAILPWGTEVEDVPRLSPVDASARYLEHVRRAWDAAHPGAPLAEQEVVLTVPASFDEAARELTLEAANAVGLMPRLLEEPTAAFYDWMHRAGDDGVASLLDGAEGGDGDALVLVVDVGGGTTDLSLIRVARDASAKSGVAVERVAVGRHLLLGGDNMDLALAHACEARMTREKLDPARFAQLVAACRDAKEHLLAADAPAEVRVAIAGAGSKLVGSTLSATITRDEAEALVLDGFWPRAPRDAEPARSRAGLVGFGLPYERDVAITRHVAAFFARHAPPGAVAPRALLLNGGVFNAARISARLVESIDGWREASALPLRVLPHADPDLAVARGAVAYALARRGIGRRIGGGSPRGYYVEVAGEGARGAVCVVPRGAREGAPQIARSRPLTLVLGRPARFELWASDEAAGHAPGDVVAIDEDRFVRLPPIAAKLTSSEARGEELRVVLEGELTDVGTLDLACVEAEPAPGAEPRRFRLAFALRGGVSLPPPAGPTLPPPSLRRLQDDALTAVVRVFGKKGEASSREVKDLVRDLEKLLGERATWTTPTARALFDALAPGRGGRRRSPDHERVFWQLAGFCLRPGFGDPLDPARIATLAPLAPTRLTFPDQARGWQQFWIAWRRVAAGLDEAQQSSLRDVVDPWIAPDGTKKKPKGAKPQAEPEMLDMASTLERVARERRGDLGGWLVDRTFVDRDPQLWAKVGRLGSRVPAYAPIDRVVSPIVAERWIDQLLRRKWEPADAPILIEAAVRLARVTGDRARDVGDGVRKLVAKRLVSAGATEEQIRPVNELVAIEEAERVAFWGESLPVGLRLE